MKTMTKKMGAIVLALAMCFSLCCTALAANSDDTTGSITITGAVAGEEYSIYQMFYLTYATDESGTVTSYSYVVPDEWYDFLTHYTAYFTLISVESTITYIDPSSPIFEEGAGGLDMAEFAQAALDYANKADEYEGREGEVIEPVATISFTYDAETGTATPSGKCSIVEGSVKVDEDTGVVTASLYIDELDLGYYLVDTTLGSLCMLDSTAPDAEINEKNDKPDLTKTVDEDLTEATENHKSVEYELDIDHITGVSSLVLHDNMQVDQSEVSYVFDYDNMSVILYDGETEITMEEGIDYVLIKSTDAYQDGDHEGEPIITDGCDFHVVFTVGGVDYDFSKCSENAYIEVKVGCELDALDGFTFSDTDLLDIPNLAAVTYGNGGESIWRRADVYEYGFHVFKYTEKEGSEALTPLAGATFTLSNSDGEIGYFSVSEEDGSYLLQGWGDIPEEYAEVYTSDLVSDSEGDINIEGLGASTYVITETAAPDGYNMLDYTITVTITADETDKSQFTVTYQPNTEGSQSTTSDNDTVMVENNAGTVLPSTGGIGTTIFYIIGGVLVAGAVVVLITRRRMSHEA